MGVADAPAAQTKRTKQRVSSHNLTKRKELKFIVAVLECQRNHRQEDCEIRVNAGAIQDAPTYSTCATPHTTHTIWQTLFKQANRNQTNPDHTRTHKRTHRSQTNDDKQSMTRQGLHRRKQAQHIQTNTRCSSPPCPWATAVITDCVFAQSRDFTIYFGHYHCSNFLTSRSNQHTDPSLN